MTSGRERALKVLLVVAGLIFLAGLYVVIGGVRHAGAPGEDSGDTMMFSIYFTLGVFLLMAVRNPGAHRSLILFAGWANVAHGAVMALMSIRMVSERTGLLGAAAAFIAIGLALVILSPAKAAADRVETALAGRG
jgi:uncharacterized protein DUF6632